MSEIIKTENLQYAYPVEEGQLAVPVLKGVNLSINRGEFVAVLGHNGSGKSTLAGCFNAIRLPTGGVCYVDMMDTRDENNTYEVRKTQRLGQEYARGLLQRDPPADRRRVLCRYDGHARREQHLRGAQDRVHGVPEPG